MNFKFNGVGLFFGNFEWSRQNIYLKISFYF